MKSRPRFLSIGWLEPRADWHLDAHSHQFHHELIVVLAGKLRVVIRGQTLEARAGDLFWYPAGVAHEEWSDRRDPCKTLFLVWEWTGASVDWPLHQSDAQGRVAELARWLLAERDSHYPGRQALRDALLQAVVAEYQRLATHEENPLVGRLRAHVHQHLAEAITLDQLATAAGLSKFHLVRRYRQLTGRTPMEDVRHLRLQAARDLLLTTNLPLREIAPRAGLGDEYHLSRLFRRHFQATPGALRRR